MVVVPEELAAAAQQVSGLVAVYKGNTQHALAAACRYPSSHPVPAGH
jgi:hypothetical protein